ncbi:uncharacterized protein LOC121712314 [Alosa sapidissima]|uniref:uncharacterized protein LOC121712314 n=1 Tax=Alosa sapidissima TaxID=34773 RepID=UPI001C0873F7|nr:uncharacterized protein LOC121712314 [Alosa sapidissima]
MEKGSPLPPAKDLDKRSDKEEEEYDDDDGFVGESGKDPIESEDDVLSTGIDDFGEEDDGVLDIEIEGGLPGKANNEVVAALESDGEFFNPVGRKLSIWDTTKLISKWRWSHLRGYHIGLYSHDEAHKNLISSREEDIKSSIPLPIVSIMQKEALRILEKIEQTYRSDLGANHELTKDVQNRIKVVRAQLAAKYASVPTCSTGWPGFLQNWYLCLKRIWYLWPWAKAEEVKEERMGWGQWLRSLLRRAPASTEEEESTPPPAEAQEQTLQTGWGQWLGNLLKRSSTATESREGEESKLPPAAKGEVTESEDSDIPPTDDPEREEGQQSWTGWRQRLGTLRGWRVTGGEKENKLPLESIQS